MSDGVSFADHAAHAEGVSLRSYQIGAAFAAAIPQPSAEAGGMRDVARWWAAHVGKIVPLWDASHVGDEKKANSNVLGAGWDVDSVASRDDQRVWDWWTNAPLANIGFASRANGILIIDLDPRHGGLDRFWAFAREHGIDLDDVPRSMSPRGDGGQHLWWRVPDRLQKEAEDGGIAYPHSSLMQGVDRPWQVPVPPSMRLVTVDAQARDESRRKAYRPYLWTAGDPRVLPEAPEVLLGPGENTQGGGGSDGGAIAPLAGREDVPRDLTGTPGAGGGGWTEAEGLARWDVPVGEQSYTFKRMACSMVAKKWDDDTIVQALLITAQRSDVGDPDHPWQEHELRAMTQHARRFIERARADEARRNQAMAANLMRRFF